MEAHGRGGARGESRDTCRGREQACGSASTHDSPQARATLPARARTLLLPLLQGLGLAARACLSGDRTDKKPCLDQTQCTTTGKMSMVMIVEYVKYASSRARSATAPETMVAAAAAKVNWKKKNAQSYPLSEPGVVQPSASSCIIFCEKKIVGAELLTPMNGFVPS